MAVIIEFEGRRPRVADSGFIAPTAVLLGDVEIGENVSVWFSAVLRADYASIKIGPECNIQDNLSFTQKPSMGPCSRSESPSATAILHDCWIGRESLIGMGAILLDRSRIGPRSLVAAGSVLKERFEVPAGTLAVGNPAINKKKTKARRPNGSHAR
jgi:carbonic anhydrase/acetyltransferase-like protein (isoleucine patch superfamily)